MKTLLKALDDYLALRRSMGFKLKEHERALRKFVAFMHRKEAGFITTQLALAWAQQPLHTSQAHRAHRLGMVRDFARKEIAPHGLEWDEAQHFPRELFTQLGELGLLGVVIPEEYGGAGLGYVEYSAILEEIGAADGAIGISVAAHN